MIVLFVGLPIAGLFCWLVFDVLLEPFLSRTRWQPNRGARTSASPLVAPAPPPIAPQGPPPPAPLSRQP